MSSYQDLETRLETIERKVDFILKTGRMRATLATGVMDASGQPVVKTFEGSLLELYHLSSQLPTKLASEQGDN